MKIRPVEVELFRANGRTDITQLIVAFRDLAKAPKNALPQLIHSFCYFIEETYLP